MKRISKYILLTLICILLTACGKEELPPSSESPVDLNTLTELPVISIQTTSTDSDAMDFVTQTLARHVAEQIASWTPDYVLPPAPYYEECTITVTLQNKVLMKDTLAQVKARGNWTTQYDKKPLRIKFNEPQNLLGLNDGAKLKDWLLLAEYKDASLLRDKTAFTLAKELYQGTDFYVSDAEFVEVVINGNYWGVYLLAEQQEINKDRVNITEAEKDYKDVDIGYFLEYDSYAYTEEPLQQVYIDYDIFNTQQGITIKSDIYSEAQKHFIASYLDKVFEIMYKAAYENEAYIFDGDYSSIHQTTELSPQEAVERVVNLPSLVDAYLINEILCDADINWSSFYFSVDFGPEGDKCLTFEAPWDFDSSMGLKNFCANGDYFFAADFFGEQHKDHFGEYNPWLAVLMNADWYKEMVKTRWTDIYDSGVFERVYSTIEKEQERCTPAFERNYKKWKNINHPIFIEELCRQSAQCYTQNEAYDYMMNWLKNRVAFLNLHLHN